MLPIILGGNFMTTGFPRVGHCVQGVVNFKNIEGPSQPLKGLFATAPFSRTNAYSSSSQYGLFLTCGRKIPGYMSIYIIIHLCDYPFVFAALNVDILELLPSFWC